jgi:hypothetical protein
MTCLAPPGRVLDKQAHAHGTSQDHADADG